jgi:D-threo-aldose 1-dehydrogenase
VTLAGVFGGGMLWGENVLRYRPAQQEEMERRERWKQLCANRGCSLQAAALHFSFLPACVSSVCIGVLSKENVVTNLALCDETVPLALWEDAKREGLLPDWFVVEAQ